MINARIQKRYAGFMLDVAFVAQDAVTVLFGPSGSGKTLTLDSIAGLARPDHGRISIDGEAVYDSATGVNLPPQARRTGYVFQNYALFPHMTLRANLEFVAAGPKRVDEMLDQFRLRDVSGRRPHQLSGGQKQRGSIARALIGRPRVLLLDEPARGLDASLRVELYGILRQVRAEFGTPALLVTHDLDECFELDARMLVLHEGRVVQSGSPREVLDRPANVAVARLLGRHNLMQVEVRGPGVVAYRDFELRVSAGGRATGETAWLCTRPEMLAAQASPGDPGPNQIVADLIRVVALTDRHRLEFAGGIAVEARRLPDPLPGRWVIEFPADAIQLL